MKKLFIVLALFLAASGSIQAQTWAEWFKQKKTQKKYLLQQIAAFKVYIEYAQKGYKIAQQGLTTIEDLSNGEFDLHGDYFSSLKAVTPEIKGYYKVSKIIGTQLRIVQDYHQLSRQVNQSSDFSATEKAYIQKVFEKLLQDCEATLDELLTVITSGNLEMEDSERMARIDKLYLDMQDKYTFSKSFGNDTKTLAAARLRENNDLHTSRALHGIKNEQP